MKNQDQRGLSLLGLVIVVIILILLLSYFGINLRNLVENPTTRENISFLKSLWDTYLAGPVDQVWNFISNILKNALK